ncbi:MAG: hypothetical protein ACOX6W_10245 [Lentisphaeria bacterium]|jgi:hypothetical protein
MKRRELKAICADLVEQFSKRPYKEWQVKDYPIDFELEVNNELIQVELNMLENNPDYIQIGVAVNDRGLSASFPVGRTFIVDANSENMQNCADVSKPDEKVVCIRERKNNFFVFVMLVVLVGIILLIVLLFSGALADI